MYDICIVAKYHGNRSKVKVTKIVKNAIVDNSDMTHGRNVQIFV